MSSSAICFCDFASFVQEIWGSELQAVLFVRLLVLHSRSWMADLFHSHLPVGGAAGSVARVSALFKIKKQKNKKQNTTSLVLSVQHSTTRFSFCHFFLTIMPKNNNYYYYYKKSIFPSQRHWTNTTQTEIKTLIKASIPDRTRHLRVVLETERRGEES